MADFKPVRNTTLPEAIVEQILAMIASGQFRPGDRLPTEAEMIEQFGVGRSTLREALASLAMVGLIEARRGAGTFVSESNSAFLSNRLNWAVMFSEQEVRDIVDVRLALEGQTAMLAATRATAEQKEKMARLVEAMRDSSQGPDRMTEHDTAFHVAVAEASHNLLLLNLILIIRDLLRDYMRWGFANEVDAEDNVTVHRQILQAIQAGDPESARTAMLAHVEASGRWILRAAQERRLASGAGEEAGAQKSSAAGRPE